MDIKAITRLLPEVFQAGIAPGSVLETILLTMQAQHAPTEEVLSDLDRWFDARRAPDAFVMLLASWLGLEPTLIGEADTASTRATTIDPGALRELVVQAAALSRRRGTGEALLAMLEIATSCKGFAIIENPADAFGLRQPFHMRIEVPAAALPHQKLVARIVETWKPAFVTHDLHFAT